MTTPQMKRICQTPLPLLHVQPPSQGQTLNSSATQKWGDVGDCGNQRADYQGRVASQERLIAPAHCQSIATGSLIPTGQARTAICGGNQSPCFFVLDFGCGRVPRLETRGSLGAHPQQSTARMVDRISEASAKECGRGGDGEQIGTHDLGADSA